MHGVWEAKLGPKPRDLEESGVLRGEVVGQTLSFYAVASQRNQETLLPTYFEGTVSAGELVGNYSAVQELEASFVGFGSGADRQVFGGAIEAGSFELLAEGQRRSSTAAVAVGQEYVIKWEGKIADCTIFYPPTKIKKVQEEFRVRINGQHPSRAGVHTFTIISGGTPLGPFAVPEIITDTERSFHNSALRVFL